MKKRFRYLAGQFFAQKWVRWLIGIAVIVIAVVVMTGAGGFPENFGEKYKDADLSTDVEGVSRSEVTYNRYLALPRHADAADASQTVPLDLGSAVILSNAASRGKTDPEIAHVYNDGTDEVLYTGDGSFVQWTVEIPESGWYNVEIDYRAVHEGTHEGVTALARAQDPQPGESSVPVFSRGVDIERALYIDYGEPTVDEKGELVYDEAGNTIPNKKTPFSGASALTFTLLWHDSGPKTQDNQGNDRRPSQEEVYGWQDVRCSDAMGYVVEPYRFYFSEGTHTLSLRAVNEPMEIRSISLTAPRQSRTYEEYRAIVAQDSPQSADIGANDKGITVQGEDSTLRSSPSLYARYDRSSPATEPYDVYHTILNYIGGDAWNNAGQWIEWDVDVPEDGWYLITIKARQNHQRGAISCRSLYIDGEIPFKEVSSLSFSYDTAWKMYTVADGEGNPYRFFLKKGTRRIRLEATLGDMGQILQEMDDSINRLNQIYRKILVLTGVTPDRFRDYNLETVYPEVIDGMNLEYKRLYKLVDDTVAITGQKSDRIAVAQTLAVQMEGFVNHTERITQSFSNFKDNITALGTAMQNMSETKLDVDLIVVHGENYSLPGVHEGFFAGAGHEIRSLVASYSVDYDALGDKYEGGDVLDVWITTGRDQSSVLKTLIDQDFTPRYGINVNVKLVLADTLLTAVVAGNGPDIVLSVGAWFPVNYAMRHAVEDMTQFDKGWDYTVKDKEGNEVPVHVKSFAEATEGVYEDSSLAPFRYRDEQVDANHVGVYAIPETMQFSVVFYRKDVLEEMGMAPEDWDDLEDWDKLRTWDNIIALLPTIQGNNMSIGVVYPDIANVDTSVLNSMIYQHGGQIYDEYNTRTLIDSEEGVAAFKLYTSLYNDYGLPTVYDFVSRFRTGEMPIGVADYSMYNNLAVSAPEIRGLWDFTYFPGTVRTAADGSTYIDNTVHCTGLCCMIIKTDDEKIRNNAWTFIQWWADEATQVSFGREMESILGSSARYTTANKQAIEQLGWSDSQLTILKNQMAKTRGFPEIAGGYSTTRHMTNAIRRVINTKEDARETLLTYSKTINEEIKIKRQEFGLATDPAELRKTIAPEADAPAASDESAADSQ
ncbi:MAG: extracellular solute-binding protein [Clostridia bacterium]|nr:extracellular solute-binding protein [Clostridia bacterium]